MASKGINVVQRPRLVPHEYATVSDRAEKCRANLAARLFVTAQAGKDWKTWAQATDDKDIIDAVNAAIRAVKAAHQTVAPRTRTKRQTPEEKWGE